MPLRLSAAQGGLGIELYEPQSLGPVRVLEMSWALPGLSFPVDLSGGVRAFRHRRGRLQRVAVGIDPEQLASWLRPRLREILGGLRETPSIWLVPCGLAVGVNAAQGALAFELLWVPAGDQPRLVVANARAAGIDGPALAHALHVVDTALGRWGTRRGRLIELRSLPAEVVRVLLPEVGFRSPESKGLTLSDFEVRDEYVVVSASAGTIPFVLPQPALRALELAGLTRTADDELLAGNWDQARAAYVSALEKAPRHPELCQMVASIDVAHAERTEAALGLLIETLPATSFGLVGAELLAQVGDQEGAQLAISQHTQAEPFAPLAALMWLRLAQLSPEPKARMDALDQAIAAGPSSEPARWARFEARVQAADVNGAIADAEHLEAAASGSAERHARVVRAAQALLAAGFVQPAGRLFERALRYLPSDAEATVGLAESLLASARPERAAVLLERSVELAANDERIRSRACLSLAKLLAQFYRDLPQAISRARQVSGADAVAIEARALEAIWRQNIGDLAGATVCFGRLRDAIELAPHVDARQAGLWLRTAAEHALQVSGDARAAERHLAVALRLNPRDRAIQDAYRQAADRVLPEAEIHRPASEDSED